MHSRMREGIHAMFAAEVPFIPSFLSADFVGPLTSGTSRIRLIADRQARFVSDLAKIRHWNVTFDMRFIFTPPHGVRILFIGKVFKSGNQEKKAVERAQELWLKFKEIFPSEDPYNYPLVPVTLKWLKNESGCDTEPCHLAKKAFEEQVLLPIPVEQISADNFSELRKFEDWDNLALSALGNEAASIDVPSPPIGYFVHSLQPIFEIGAYTRLLQALNDENQKCLVRISLRPTWLTYVEMRILNQVLSNYAEQLPKIEGWLRTYKQERLVRMEKELRMVLDRRYQLFTTGVQVLGQERYPSSIVSTLLSEITATSSSTAPRIFEMRVKNNAEDIAKIQSNIAYLEHEFWGGGIGGTYLRRMPQLLSSEEAVGIFRLPIPPESGYLPGVAVKDEPFVEPQGTTEKVSVEDGAHSWRRSWPGGNETRTKERILIGDIIHRGTRSGSAFCIPAKDMMRHALIAGSTGTGKTNTCLVLLEQLWRNKIPFLVLYPISKPDYRILMRAPSIQKDLLIFTAGDTASPFRFNPFFVPKKILLRTHISNLMRAFSAGLYMWGPLPELFRETLRQLYRKNGWEIDDRSGDRSSQRTPSLIKFHSELKKLSSSWAGNYNAEVRGDLRQDSEVKIKGLLETAGTILNVQFDEESESIFDHILDRPTVIELGQIGSANDIALVMGFLITSLTEHIQAKFSGKEIRLRHVTLIEEAHRVMSAQTKSQGDHVADPRSGASEDFANILSEVRAFGEGIIIAEQSPTKLISDALANTYFKVMHWLEDYESYNLFSQLMNLNERQRQHARTLGVGEVIVRNAVGSPVLLKAPYYSDGLSEDATSDADIAAFMERQLQRLNIYVPPLEMQPAQNVRNKSETERETLKDEILKATEKRLPAAKDNESQQGLQARRWGFKV